MALQDAVKTIVESLVTHPEDVLISSDESEDSRLRINISVNPEDRGRVIGRQGKTINALRTVIKAAAVKANKRVVDVHVSRLRSKLEKDPSDPELILTARGTGYMFQNYALNE